jgi:arginine decarboxylase
MNKNSGLTIQIVSGFGEGETLLSAFDSALQTCGVFNYNLLILSSIIPPHSKIVKTDKYQPKGKHEYGHKLYVVKSDIRSNEIGKFIGAGVAWYQKEDGRGVFVEHSEKGDDRKKVEGELLLKLERSIHDLCRFRNMPFEHARMHKSYSIGQITNKAGCALTLAVYKAEGWE